MRRVFGGSIITFAALAASAAADCTSGGAPHPAFYEDAALFTTAIRAAPGSWSLRPSGITVPHHLLVPELLADGIGRARRHVYDRVILLFPDHFGVLGGPFGTLTAGFETVSGPVGTDPASATLANDPRVAVVCALAEDHGLRALLPFVADALPDVPVLPVAISIKTGLEDWEALAAMLAPLVTDETLILQSTDFSHYLPHHEARQRDQETLNILAAGDASAISSLRQPDHIDSAGAMYVQMVLQDRVFGARPFLVANRNSQDFSDTPVAETTSYMVALFSAETGPLPGPVSAERLVLGGDTFFGRTIARELPEEFASARLEDALRQATGGLPLVLNLEGVLLEDFPATLPHLTLGMPAGLATDWLKRFGAVAVSLANNHADDLGDAGLGESRMLLAEGGIASFGSGEQLRFPGLAVTALSDFREGTAGVLRDADLDAVLVADPSRASVAFLHWGREFVTEPGPREADLAERLSDRGASIVIGAHPHQASSGFTLLGGGETLVLHSLGNFFFDQSSEVASGALAELVVFPQGTVFLRQHDVPNLFDIARGAADRASPSDGSKTR